MVNINSPEKFAKEFIERYLHNGFGMMNKGELETLIFYLLRKDESFKTMSIFETSRILHISEAKVRKLIYEADLRYEDTNDEFIVNEFFQYIKQAKIQSVGNKIMFPIDNKIVRSAVDDRLKSLGYFSDTSFNRDIFSIHIDAFVDLIDSYYTAEIKDEVLNKCKASIKIEGKDKITFKLILKEFICSASRTAGKLSTSTIFAALSTGRTIAAELIHDIIQILD